MSIGVCNEDYRAENGCWIGGFGSGAAAAPYAAFSAQGLLVGKVVIFSLADWS